MFKPVNNSNSKMGRLASARHGSLDAFNQLVLEYQDAAWNLAFHLLWSEASADEVVRQAIQEMYHSLGLLRRASFRIKLFYRVVRICQHRLKQQTKNLAPDPLKQSEGNASARLVLLPLPERIVLVLAELEGLDAHEISQVTGTPVSMVRQRLGNALAACLSA
ncbi:MAG TPA: sigma-70 family RNA polymerase sigma factor [Levilinea sp.]|nr:sigma-70 family RNA polymerase sigma factor [Levilinea sp.]